MTELLERDAETQAAYNAVLAWSARPKLPDWRVREHWSPAQHGAFAAELEAFAQRVPKPTKRQIKLVGEDYDKFEKSFNAATEHA
jgi:hypothetical protein